jgi:hypothetical protein
MSDPRLDALAEKLELERDFLFLCVEHGVLRVDELEGEPDVLPPARRAKLRRLQRLCGSLELDVFSGSIIVDLLERLDEMERDLEFLRGIRP